MQNHIAIILAAGMGTRLKRLDPDPKCLIEVGGKSLLNYQLDYLNQAGVKEVVIVVGYKGEKIQNIVGKQYKSLTIYYVTNNHYSSSGSAYSFLLTHSVWQKSRSPVIMLHADLLYDMQIMIDTLEDSRSDLIVLDESFQELTGDELVVTGGRGRVEALFKGPSGKENILGESLGINKWSSIYLEKYYSFLNDFVRRFGKDCNWEPTISEFLITYPEVELHYSKIDKKNWINVNYQSDVAYATEVVLRSFGS